MRTFLHLLLIGFIRFGMAAEFEMVNPEAERFYAEKSFARAFEIYAKMDLGPLDAESRRWVAFRKADTTWRAAVHLGDETSTTTIRNAAGALEELIRGRDRRDEQDRVWAEANESLAMIPEQFHQGDDRNRERWQAFQRALEWWGRSRDLDLARTRYLRLAKSIFEREHEFMHQPHAGEILENAAKIAQSDNDRGWAFYQLGLFLSQRGQPLEIDRARAAFEEVFKIGKTTEWHDDALHRCAQWMLHSGRIRWDDEGNAMPRSDRVRALELFRKITSEYREGESPFHREARAHIAQITGTELTLAADSLFAPGSRVEVNFNFQNVRQVEFTLKKVDLLRDFKMWDDRRQGSWGAAFEGADGEVLKRWSRDFSGKEEYENHHEAIVVDEKLAAGSYVLEASAGGRTAREFIAVTDIVVVVKAAADRTLLFVCNAETGAPIEGADVKLWFQWRENRNTWTTQRVGRTDASGLAEFPAEHEESGKGLVQQIVALASNDGKPAFATPWPVRAYRNSGQEWRLYLVTDRPAYRPGEKVHWKLTARRMDGETYSTPTGAKLHYEIHDARRNKVKEGDVTLNSFGSAWGELDLAAEMALGVFHIQFREGNNHIGGGNFRMEEYKLPEFKVAVKMPEENGRPKSFRLGEKVEVTVDANYYFGGAVSDAAVKVVVRKQGLYHIFQPKREFAWFYGGGGFQHPRWRGQEGEVILERELRADADGKATFSFETSAYGSEDLQFDIEARVTDASRREIVGHGTVKVTRHKYRVFANATHSLHRPGDEVTIEFTARDPNENPVSAEGKVTITREFWREVWQTPDGREIRGEELEKLREKTFPPAPGWRLKFRGYEKEPITTAAVKTDNEGEAEYKFTPQREGYYRVVWLSETGGQSGPAVRAETTAWVLTNRSTELGYRHGALQIIVDKDTFRVGQKASVMLHAPQNDCWVLLTTGIDRIFRREVIHLDGTVKLVELDIGEEHVPNFFLEAVMISDGQIHMDNKEIVVPPVKNFLAVEVKPDQREYRVRDQGEYTIVTKNHDGKPVEAEVSLGVVDESVFYIQEEMAGDPRQFFFAQKRFQRVNTASTFQLRNYRQRVDKDSADALYDSEEPRRRMAARGSSVFFADRLESGGVAGRAMNLPAAMPSAPPMKSPAASEMLSLGVALADTSTGAVDQAGAEPLLRADFRSTLFWQPDVKTDADGTARVKVKFPDSTTGWKATARAATAGNQFGIGGETVRTTQPLIIRLQAPRFFVVGDEVTVSAVINNNASNEVSVTPQIEVSGLKLSGKSAAVRVPAKGEKRVDWRVVAEHPGEAKIKVTGRSADASDAMERAYPVHEHGIEKFLTASGILNTNEAVVTIDLPLARKTESTKFVVQATPSLAVTMLDALPYLIDYPYGCAEQTMSRFLPAAIVARTLRGVGLDPEDAMRRTFGGIEAAHAARTQPKGRKAMDQLDDMVAAGLQRLAEMRHGDGGWGWWAEGDSDAWMTAYVVWGLAIAREAGLDIPGGLLEGGADFLRKRIVEAEGSPESQAWQLHALAAARGKNGAITDPEKNALENLWAKRDALSSYARALFAISAHHLGDREKTAVLIRNLENGVKRDENPGSSAILNAGIAAPTAHWGSARTTGAGPTAASNPPPSPFER